MEKKLLNEKICFLVSNDINNDPRVQREAQSAAAAGFCTTVFGYYWPAFGVKKAPKKESYNGYQIIREEFDNSPNYTPIITIFKLANFFFKFWPLNQYKKRIKGSILPEPQTDIKINQTAKISQNQIDPQPTKQTNPGFAIRIVNNLSNTHQFLIRQMRIFNYYYSLTKHSVRVGTKIKPDIVHANDLDTLLAGYLIKKKTGAKLVYDAHEIWTEMGSSLPRYIIFIFKILEKILLKQVDAFISINPSIIDQIGKMHKVDFAGSKIITAPIYNAPNYQKIICRTTKRNPVKILYQGRYEATRGLEELIMASDFVKGNAQVYFRGYGSLEGNLKVMTRQKKIRNLIFLKPVAMNSLVQMASFVDIGVIPYLPVNVNNQLCSPNKLFEYMMGGLALACSDLPEMRKIIKKYQNGVLFDPREPKSIARALNKMVKNSRLLTQMKENSLGAAKELNWEKEEKKLVRIYEDLLK